ncbi:MAG: response regulator transcription factor [Steroidobacteraceae bacterium]|jgi:DNA-binding NarL/FixJ family response regulator
MSSVLIADDHSIVRAGLRAYLQADRSIRSIGETASGNETLQRLRSEPWDLVLLDINMPDRSGIDILRHIRSGHPDTRVLVMSGFAENVYAVNVLKAGAAGYLSKDQGADEILRAVRTVLAGRRYVSAALSEMLVDALDEPPEQPAHAILSQREFQILCKIAVGRSISEIGKELLLSVKTISTYRARVLEKMNFATNADLTTYALRNGLVL